MALPMLPVGSRPLLETIVRTIAEHGFERIYLANYRADLQIEAHFGDGSALGLGHPLPARRPGARHSRRVEPAARGRPRRWW
ncbi:MAG: hypothetical protein U1F49_02715 [Rubrivivax sp.]